MTEDSNVTTWHAVRVHMSSNDGEGFTFEDAIPGRNRADAESAARHNWITATPATPAERIEYLGPEYGIGDRVVSLRSGVTGHVAHRIEPGGTDNEDRISPRLFVVWDGAFTEDEVGRADIAPES